MNMTETQQILLVFIGLPSYLFLGVLYALLSESGPDANMWRAIVIAFWWPAFLIYWFAEWWVNLND